MNRRDLFARLALVAVLVASPFAEVPPALAADGAGAGERIVVADAASPLGGEVIDALLERGVPFSNLILVSRAPEGLEPYAARGAEVREARFDRSADLQKAFAGGRRLLIVSPGDPANAAEWLAEHVAVIGAARSADIRHVVYPSIINPTADNPMPEVRGHSRVEEALDVGAVPFTVLRRQLFMDDLLGPARRAVSSGTLYSNSARSRWAPIAVRDFAAVVAVVLTTNGHEGRFYSITGPELINAPEVGEMVAGVTGRRVSVIDLPDSQWIERAVARGVPEAMAQAEAQLGAAIRLNALNIRNEAAEILLGRKPQTLRELLAQNQAVLLAAPDPAQR